MNVILRVDERTPGSEIIEGEVESRYGRHPFSGWLELLGQLEALVDRARSDPGRTIRRAAPDP